MQLLMQTEFFVDEIANLPNVIFGKTKESGICCFKRKKTILHK